MTAAADLKFVLAKADGSMGTTVVQSAENSVWPDVMPTERVAGARSTKRLYGAVLSEDNYPLVGAKVGFAGWPGDSAIDMLLSGAGVDPSAAYGSVRIGTANFTVGETTVMYLSTPGAAAPPVGAPVRVTYFYESGNVGAQVLAVATILNVEVDPPGYSGWTRLTLYYPGGTPPSGGYFVAAGVFQVTRLAGSAVSASKTTESASAGATSVVVGSLLAATSGTPAGITFLAVGGYVPRFLPGDLVAVQHTNGTTREWKAVLSINYATKALTFSTPLVNAYPPGSIISSALSLGDLQARVTVQPFSLQTWSRTWADSLPSGALAPTATYRGTPLCNNAGTITERWALVFRSDTIFDVVGERLGQIATGNVGTDFKPLNPMTNEPYFELQASMWSGGFLPGNALRFNTVGAHAAFDAHRVVAAGSTAGSGTSAPMFLSGDVNA